MTFRSEEIDLLESCKLPKEANVLDYGCGVGRYLKHIRKIYPQAHCVGIEICDQLREHCNHTISAPSTFVQTLEELPDIKYDLIMLMGNGLGVLGDENNAKSMLKILVNSLNPQGCIIIETGNPFSANYSSPQFTIEYQGRTDNSFTWGYSDRNWITTQLETNGCSVEIKRSQAPGGIFFIAIGCKN